MRIYLSIRSLYVDVVRTLDILRGLRGELCELYKVPMLLRDTVVFI